MSEFTDEELNALRIGGNARASKIWRSGFRGQLPNEGDERSIKEHIRSCFVDKRYFNATEWQAFLTELQAPVQSAVPVSTSLPAQTLAPPQQTVLHTAPPQQTVLYTAPPVALPPTRPTAVPDSKTSTLSFFDDPPAAVVQPKQPSVTSHAIQHSTPHATLHATEFDDFFSGPKVAVAEPAPNSKQVTVSDLFYGLPSQPVPNVNPQHQGTAANFFGNAWAPVSTTVFSGSTVPVQATPSAPAPKSASRDVFAALDPFGGKPR